MYDILQTRPSIITLILHQGRLITMAGVRTRSIILCIRCKRSRIRSILNFSEIILRSYSLFETANCRYIPRKACRS